MRRAPLSEGDAVVDTDLRALCADISTAQTREVQLFGGVVVNARPPVARASGHNHWCDHQPPPRCAAPTSLIVALVLFALFQALIVFTLVRSDRRKAARRRREGCPAPMTWR